MMQVSISTLGVTNCTHGEDIRVDCDASEYKYPGVSRIVPMERTQGYTKIQVSISTLGCYILYPWRGCRGRL